jgi:predicted signal transduction protein with EAL and GGDEF domain
MSQVAGLKMLGCQVAQGFYFSHPLHADEFDRLLTRHFAASSEAPGQLMPGQLMPGQLMPGQRAHP